MDHVGFIAILMDNVGLNPFLMLILLLAFLVLLPLAPAILIYKLFPNTKVGVSGPLQGLTFNASGAFAAYVVTALLGSILMLKAQDFIEPLMDQDWSITAKVVLLDHQGNPITGTQLETLLHGLTITFLPDQRITQESVRAIFPERKDAAIQYSLSGYTTKTKLLSGEQFQGLELYLGRITLAKIQQKYPHDLGSDYLVEEEVASSLPDGQKVVQTSLP